MKNVEKSMVQGKMQKFCQGLANEIGVIAVGAAVLLAPLGTTTAKAESGKSVTQLQYIQWLAQMSGANLGSASSDAAISWAKSQGINPTGGWKSGDTLSHDMLAQTLVQVLGLNANKYGGDFDRILKREEIDLGDIKDSVNKDNLVSLVDQFAIQARFGSLDAAKKGTTSAPKGPKPPKPSTKVSICHKGHTITVSQKALSKHLAHGDTIGSCTVTQHGHDKDDDDHSNDHDDD